MHQLEELAAEVCEVVVRPSLVPHVRVDTRRDQVSLTGPLVRTADTNGRATDQRWRSVDLRAAGLEQFVILIRVTLEIREFQGATSRNSRRTMVPGLVRADAQVHSIAPGTPNSLQKRRR